MKGYHLVRNKNLIKNIGQKLKLQFLLDASIFTTIDDKGEINQKLALDNLNTQKIKLHTNSREKVHSMFTKGKFSRSEESSKI